MNKLVAILILVLLPAAAIAAGQDKPLTGEQVYKKSCFACHDTGVLQAPKLGDKAAWAPRIAEGMDELFHVALHGEGQMPAKGGDPSLSDEEIKAAVTYMVEKSK